MIKGKRTRRITALLLVIAMFVGTSAVFAVQNTESKNKDTKVISYMRPDIPVVKDGKFMYFFNEQGEAVSPMVYEGETYLPIRALCSLKGEPVEWEAAARTVYIGRTLSRPSKSLLAPEESPYVQFSDTFEKGNQSASTAYIKNNALVMYDFEIINLDEGIIPIICKGTTYLPLTCFERIIGEKIVQDQNTKQITIGESDKDNTSDKLIIPEKIKDVLHYYERQSELYNDVTSKILLINNMSKNDLNILLKTIEKDYIKAAEYNREMSMMLDDLEKTQHDKAVVDAVQSLQSFAEGCEYYILVMQNIIYMAANDQDYSMFADPFLNFALMSQTAMNDCFNKINAIISEAN